MLRRRTSILLLLKPQKKSGFGHDMYQIRILPKISIKNVALFLMEVKINIEAIFGVCNFQR